MTILFEDHDLVVVVKPAGLATANVPRGQESVLTRLREAGGRPEGGDRAGAPAAAAPGPADPAFVEPRVRERPAEQRRPLHSEPFLGVVSRLDMPVSGVVVVARSRRAAASLSQQFRERSVDKIYHALVEGRFPAPPETSVRWCDILERPADDTGAAGRGRSGRAAAPPAVRVLGSPPALPAAGGKPANPQTGQEAVLEVELLARGVEVSLVELRPETGRRHQLRAQLAAHGCPIVGDRLYGSRLPFPQGIALHSSRLTFDHPQTGQRLVFNASWPASWRQAARGLVLPEPGVH